MIEDFITELDKPLKAMRLLLILMDEYVEDNLCIETCSNERERKENILAISHAIGLVRGDISRIRRKYYKSFLKEFYSRWKIFMLE